MEDIHSERNAISELATKYGLILLGIVKVTTEPDFYRFVSWLKEDRHAEMKYLENHLALRKNPAKLLPGCQSAIIFALPYSQGDRFDPGKKTPFKIAQYARMRDYHRSLKTLLETLAKELLLTLPEGTQFRALTDSAPLLERALAARTEKGFIGKNTLYIHPLHGSFLLLGELLLTTMLEPDDPPYLNPAQRKPEGGCGSCRRCQVYCPTKALDQDYRLDARKCLAYLTIENRGTIPVKFWKHLKSYIFGCDICQLVCPWNRGADFRLPKTERRFSESLHLPDLVRMSQAEYESWFGGTPLTRAKKSGLKRNALIAMVVSGHPDLSTCLCFAKAEADPLILETIRQIPDYQRLKKDTFVQT